MEENGEGQRRNEGGCCGRLKREFEEVNELLRIEGAEVETYREDWSRYPRDLRVVRREEYLTILFMFWGSESLLPPPQMAIERVRISSQCV